MCNENVSQRELSVFKDLDNLLQCGICYEYMKTCIITPCSHNYCSYCIRKSLMYKPQCPSCFEETTESQLRNNRVLDEIIRIFTLIRGKMLKCFTTAEGVYKSVSQNEVCSSSENNIRAAGISFNNTLHPSSSSLQNNDSPKKEILIPSMFSPKKSKGNKVDVRKVPCPVCSVDISESNINIHLDACLKRIEESEWGRNSKNEKRKPLPKLVYTLMQDKMLRKKLLDLGLCTTGDRKALINRHKRYTLLYNSECDSPNPRPVSEIIKQLGREEQEEKKVLVQPLTFTRLVVDRNADPKDIQEAQRQYLQHHKSSFQNLIEQIKGRSNMTSAEKTKRDINDKDIIVIEESSTSSEEMLQLQQMTSRRRRRVLSEGGDEVDVAAGIHLSSSAHNVSNASSGTGSVDELTLLHEALDHESLGEDQQVDVAGGAGSKSGGSSPILGTRNRQGETLEMRVKEERSETPDIFQETSPLQCSPLLPAGQEDKCKEEDSDDSVSLMIYQDSEVCPSPGPQTTPGCEALKSTSFDVGCLESILPSSEELVPTPARRSSRRLRGSSPPSLSCTSPRLLRKRTKHS